MKKPAQPTRRSREHSAPKGIFCLEGAWEDNLTDRTSVLPLLRLLEDTDAVPYVHKSVATDAELTYYLRRWRRYSSFKVLYLSFHGVPGGILLSTEKGEETTLDLGALGKALEGQAKGRLIHFGSCDTLKVSDDVLHEFLETTGAVALSGYKRAVDWTPSAAFELLLFSILQEKTLTSRGLQAVRKWLTEKAGGLAADWRLEPR